MTTEVVFYAQILSLVIGVIVTAMAVQFALRPAVVDSFRQRIFSIRRESFVLVASGVIKRDDPEYLETRLFLNGLLRFAELFSFLRVVGGTHIFHDFNERMNETGGRNLYDFPKSPDAAISERLQRARERAANRLLWHLFETSPLAWLTVLFYLPAVLTEADRPSGIRRVILRALAKAIPRKKLEREVTQLMKGQDGCPVPAIATAA
jgi:hypothetical protein